MYTCRMWERDPVNKLNSVSPRQADVLDALEAQSINIIREVVACFRRPVLLYSIGKDSSVLLHLLKKAFFPCSPRVELLHVDTKWKFREMISFRDTVAAEEGLTLRVHVNELGVSMGVGPDTHGSKLHTDVMKTQALRQAMEKWNFDAAIGGARRDEEKSRAKERVFSFRSSDHRWDPRRQRPEVWSNYNPLMCNGESVRVFPLSDWTELDIWRYILRERIEIVPLYFAKVRPVVCRPEGIVMVDDDRIRLRMGESVEYRMIRFRTLGCYPLTCAIESTSSTVPEIIEELESSRYSERGGRLIDHDPASSLERKKAEGYF